MKQTQHARLPPFRLQRNAEKTTERRKHQGRADERPILRRGEETMAMEWKLHVELSGIKKKAIRRLCKAFNRRSPDRQKGDDEFNFDAFVMSCTQCMDTGGLGKPLFIRYFVFVLIRFGLNFLCHPPMQVRWSSHPKLQFVIRLKSQSEKLAAMENLARSCCNHHGTRAVAP